MPYTTIQITRSPEVSDVRERTEMIRNARIRVLRSIGYQNERNGDIYKNNAFVCTGWDTLIRWYEWQTEYDERNDERYLKVTLLGEAA